jgi:hypothetical protein
MADPAYQRLTRERIPRQFAVATASRISLWLGSDHLMLVERSGFTETCKRFYFRDIQAITVRETSRRTVWNAVLTAPLAICLLGFIISASAPANTAAMITWSVIAVVCLLPFVINNLRGTTCACQLRTAVQTEDLTSLCRLSQTRRVLDRLRPLIVAAQGQLTPDEVAARMQESVLAADAARNPEPRSPSLPPVIS